MEASNVAIVDNIRAAQAKRRVNFLSMTSSIRLLLNSTASSDAVGSYRENKGHLSLSLRNTACSISKKLLTPILSLSHFPLEHLKGWARRSGLRSNSRNLSLFRDSASRGIKPSSRVIDSKQLKWQLRQPLSILMSYTLPFFLMCRSIKKTVKLINVIESVRTNCNTILASYPFNNYVNKSYDTKNTGNKYSNFQPFNKPILFRFSNSLYKFFKGAVDSLEFITGLVCHKLNIGGFREKGNSYLSLAFGGLPTGLTWRISSRADLSYIASFVIGTIPALKSRIFTVFIGMPKRSAISDIVYPSIFILSAVYHIYRKNVVEILQILFFCIVVLEKIMKKSYLFTTFNFTYCNLCTTIKT